MIKRKKPCLQLLYYIRIRDSSFFQTQIIFGKQRKSQKFKEKPCFFSLVIYNKNISKKHRCIGNMHRKTEEIMRKRFLKTGLASAVLATALILGGCGGNSGSTASETTAALEESQSAADPSKAEETEAKTEESAATEEPGSATTDSGLEATDADYLKTWFGVEFAGEDLDAEEFSTALRAVAGETAPVISDELTWWGAIGAAVEAADYKELALSYPQEKVAKRLAQYGVTVPAEEAEKLYMTNVACALDVSLVTADDVAKAAAGEPFTVVDAEKLLMKVADANGDARNYLGMASDPDIYGKVDQAWNSFILFDDGKLAEVGKEAVLQQISTGYGIKSAAYDARFLPNLTLQYGHSDIKHAHQLLGLLNSEDIDAKVQLEPKISIYQYLLEWGPIPEATPTYEVKQFDDLYLVYAVEYDMQLEFNNTEDMLRFDSVIKEFAKKNEGNEEADGLIYASWWQPLYSTTRTDMPKEDYHQMFDCVVTNGIYSIHPFALPENKDMVVEKLTELAGDLEVKTVERYCNTAFYSYLKGEDYQ